MYFTKVTNSEAELHTVEDDVVFSQHGSLGGVIAKAVAANTGVFQNKFAGEGFHQSFHIRPGVGADLNTYRFSELPILHIIAQILCQIIAERKSRGIEGSVQIRSSRTWIGIINSLIYCSLLPFIKSGFYFTDILRDLVPELFNSYRNNHTNDNRTSDNIRNH